MLGRGRRAEKIMASDDVAAVVGRCTTACQGQVPVSTLFQTYRAQSNGATVHYEHKVGASTQCRNVAPECIVDHTSEFTTDKIFKSREAMIKWIRDTGQMNGFVIVIRTSVLGGPGNKPMVSFRCNRSGKYSSTERNNQGTKKCLKMTITKKCGCPFSLMGKKLATEDDWVLAVVCGLHNHSGAEYLEGHSHPRRFLKEKSLFIDMPNNLVRSINFQTRLKKTGPLKATTMKMMHNACDRNKMVHKARRSHMHQPNEKAVVMQANSKKVYRTRSIQLMTFLDAFPAGLGPYIHLVKDVAADGNCGFRAIAGLMGFGENAWAQVRNDLLAELHSNLDHYSQLYGGSERIEELTHTLAYFEDFPAYDQWMTMPDMGHLIASHYNVILFYLSLQQCLTFLPLRSVPVPLGSRTHIAIGFINSNHFVEVFLLPDHPVPPIATNWHSYRHPCSQGWDTTYTSRIQLFREVVNSDIAIRETVSLDVD